MIVSVSGGRTYNNYNQLCTIMNHYKPWITHINHGGADGLDKMVESWCKENKIPTTILKPQYQHDHDRGAPLRRNYDIVRDTSFLLAFPTSESKGTWHAVKVAKELNVPVYIHKV